MNIEKLTEALAQAGHDIDFVANDMLNFDQNEHQKAQNLKVWRRTFAPALVKAVLDGEPDWTEEPPTEQGWYWHWNGSPDDAPIICSVMASGTNGKCFCRTSGSIPAPWCEDVGGWWKKIIQPDLPEAKDGKHE